MIYFLLNKNNLNKAVIRTMHIVRQGFVCKHRFFNILILLRFFRVIPCKWLQKMPNRLSISWIIFKKYRITIETMKMSRISLNFSFLCLKLQNKQVKGVKRNCDYRQRVSLLCCGIQTGRWNYFSLKYFELIARSRISISKFKE